MPNTPRPESRHFDFDDLPDDFPDPVESSDDGADDSAPAARAEAEDTERRRQLREQEELHARLRAEQREAMARRQQQRRETEESDEEAARRQQQEATAAEERRREQEARRSQAVRRLQQQRAAKSQEQKAAADCEQTPEQWADARALRLRAELRELGRCRPGERRTRLRSLQLELHPDKQPQELRKLAQPLFLMVQREWELNEAAGAGLHATQPAAEQQREQDTSAPRAQGASAGPQPRDAGGQGGRDRQEYASTGPGGGKREQQRPSGQRRSASALERLFDREGQEGRLGDVVVQVATGVGWPLGKFCLTVSATVKEVKHRLQESSGVPVLKQRLQCRATSRFLNDNELVKHLQEPRSLYFAELPYKADMGKQLFEAARTGDAEAAEQALLGQADPNLVVQDGWTPFLAAARAGHAEVARLLCLAGASKDALAPTGETPLILAVVGSHLGMIRFLCSVGVDKDGATQSGATPLTVASSRGLLPVVRLLCRSGADVEKAGPNGGTPLHQAARHGHLDVVRFLCQGGGADKERAAQNGTTPLLVATGLGHVEVVRLLCKVGADKYREAGGYSPLHLAAAEGHLEVVKVLCDAGADPERTNEDGVTPLSFAMQNRRQHVVQFLS